MSSLRMNCKEAMIYSVSKPTVNETNRWHQLFTWPAKQTFWKHALWHLHTKKDIH